MAISDPNGGTLGTPAGTMNIVFDPTTGGIDKTATQAANAADMAVDSDGNLKIAITGIDWTNDSDSTQTINLNISDLTQYNSDYSVGFVDQNGAELGLRTGVSIDRNGYVVSSFSNGQTRNLYKLPVATFTNPNGLQERTGNVYIQSIESGSYNLREAGSSGAGTIAASSLENSNVDLADEFSRMIITQRAYSAGTKVISTSDQMLQELLQLR
jgi:flagellar hook protein FlgE